MKSATGKSPHGSAGVQQSPLAPGEANKTFGSANASAVQGIGAPSSSESRAPTAANAAASLGA
jgi:hypothetical protein